MRCFEYLSWKCLSLFIAPCPCRWANTLTTPLVCEWYLVSSLWYNTLPYSWSGTVTNSWFVCVMPLTMVQLGFAELPRSGLWVFMRNFTKDQWASWEGSMKVLAWKILSKVTNSSVTVKTVAVSRSMGYVTHALSSTQVVNAPWQWLSFPWCLFST